MKSLLVLLFAIVLMVTTVIAQQVKVRVEVDGKVYEGNVPLVSVVASGSASSPTVGTKEVLAAQYQLVSLDVAEDLRDVTIPPLVRWDFGDGTTRKGFNAAHVYRSAGTYKIVATISPANKPDYKRVWNVTITPAKAPTRITSIKELYAMKQAPGDVIVLAPGVYVMDKPITFSVPVIGEDDVTIQYIGDQYTTNGKSGADEKSWPATPIVLNPGGSLTNVTYTNVNPSGGLAYPFLGDRNQVAGAFFVPKGNVYIDKVVMSNWTQVFNLNTNPTDVLIQGSSIDEKLSMYFVWVQGNRIAIYDCKVGDSKSEHCIRGANYNLVAVNNCELTNMDRRYEKPSEPYNYSKSAMNAQKGYGWYGANNTYNADVQFGPLGGGDGVGEQDVSMRMGVDEGSTMSGNFQLGLHHGLNGARFVNLRVPRTTFLIDEKNYPSRTIANVLFENTPGVTVPAGLANIQVR